MQYYDIILIGGGIMSATLGAILKRLDPTLLIKLFEAGPNFACEASCGWNNAGTGHAGICELSYTPNRRSDGTVDVDKAIEIFAQFAKSKEFWGFAVADGMIDNPTEFIIRLPHLSFVHGEDQIEFLRARHQAMTAHHFFQDLAFSTDRAEIARWAPLLLAGRRNEQIAATHMDGGTDVNFGVISQKLVAWLAKQPGCSAACGSRVTSMDHDGKQWRVLATEVDPRQVVECRTNFVFIGAGGGSLPLLQMSGIAESKGIGGLPIGGQWLVCTNPDIVKQHCAKVYGQALGAAPTMAVPHLDTRMLDGKRALLFGPFATWTTRFLQNTGNWSDLPRSVRLDNFTTLCKVCFDNLDLVKYLFQQSALSMADRMDLLRIFYPAAYEDDWRLVDAGIRVQAIKKIDAAAGIVHFGTEILTSADHSIAALLGASPGASVSVHIALDVIARCMPHYLIHSEHREQLEAMVPSYFHDFTQPDFAVQFSRFNGDAETKLQLRQFVQGHSPNRASSSQQAAIHDN